MIHAEWSQVLLDPDIPVPTGIVTWNGSDAKHRIAVYRNNVVVSLVDALADTFPVTQGLLGEEFFRTIAREFARVNPPRSPVLAFYGRQFPAFITEFPPASNLPYLADVARLDLAYVDAFFSAEAAPVDLAVLASKLQERHKLPDLALILHPSLRVLSSSFAIFSLWAAHQNDFDISSVDAHMPESVWVLRNQQRVKVLRMSEGDCRFISALHGNYHLGAAAEMASDADPEFDLTRSLTVLLREQAVIAFVEPN